MKTSKEFLEEYKIEFRDLDRFFNVIFEGNTKSFFTDYGLHIYLPSLKDHVFFSKKDMQELCDHRDISGVNHLDIISSFGIKYKNYYEFAVSINHPFAWMSETENEWKSNPLRFKIGSNIFEIGLMSDLMVFTTEPIYQHEEMGMIDFHTSGSMKIIINDSANYKVEFVKGAFYLNSHYLRRHNFYITLQNLYSDIDYGDFEDPEDFDKLFDKITRRRCFTRKDFRNIEPLKLYNDSMFSGGEHKFLRLYRILEFFMKTSITSKINSIRFDSSYSDEQIYELVVNKSEDKQLKNLLSECLTPAMKKRITEYCHHHKLIPQKDFKYVGQSLYEFRNSLVHSKEAQKDKAYFPDPFELNYDVEKWNFVIDDISRRCIKVYNTIPIKK